MTSPGVICFKLAKNTVITMSDTQSPLFVVESNLCQLTTPESPLHPEQGKGTSLSSHNTYNRSRLRSWIPNDFIHPSLKWLSGLRQITPGTVVPHLQGESDPLGRVERQPAAQAFFWPSLSGCTADTQECSHNEPQRRQKQPAAESNPCIGREGGRVGKEREQNGGKRERKWGGTE